MRFTPSIFALSSLIATALAACGDDNTVPNGDIAVRLYSRPDCTGASRELKNVQLDRTCWSQASVDTSRAIRYLNVVDAVSAVTNPSVVCQIFTDQYCNGSPLVTIDKTGNGTLYTIPRALKGSVYCRYSSP